ncbi:zinc finger protein [Streptomyces sp. NPDC050856]|uniref:zinc finger protein n=1 Tax=Streptomyces sp. NPDC050856 TaxID=3154939 RepID=UPI0033EF9AF5
MAASANWRCADCDTYNGPADTSCTICGSGRRTAAPRAGGGSRPAAKRPGTARPPADWRCSKCDTNNARTDLTCIVCGTGWKAAGPAAKPAPGKPAAARPSSAGGPTAKPAAKAGGGAKKSAPRKPTPKRAPAPPRTTPHERAAARPPTPPRTTAPPRAATRARDEGIFYPSGATTGYTPTAPRPAPGYPAPPPASGPDPRWTPPRPRATAAPAGKTNGCLSGCLGLVVFLVLLGLLADGCGSGDPGEGEPGRSAPSATAGQCPGRIAAELPGGEGAGLVEAFRTVNKQITLCRTPGGTLYYYGEFTDRREKGIAMEAEETSDGYEARNGPYRYVIHDGVVTIYQSGERLGEENLVPEPSPS